MRFKLAASCTLAALSAGCANERIGVRDPGLGEAVRFNAAVQTVNPDPIYPPGSAQPGDNGDRGAQAVRQYRRGEVTPIEEIGTSSTSSGDGPR